jgi:ABC-type lipoprotein export system ATPase subunit
MKLFKNLNQQGMAIVVVTHDLKVANMCSRIINIKGSHRENLMADADVLAGGEPHSLRGIQKTHWAVSGW